MMTRLLRESQTDREHHNQKAQMIQYHQLQNMTEHVQAKLRNVETQYDSVQDEWKLKHTVVLGAGGLAERCKRRLSH
jgi:hypothetical protein